MTPFFGAERLAMSSPSPTLLAVTAAATCLAIGCASYFFVPSKAGDGRRGERGRRQEGDDDDEDGVEEVDIPDARGGVPLLGHALLYRKDPASFLVEQSKAVGPIFRINLAGKRMIVVCGGGTDDDNNVALRRVTTAPESVLSARDAVAAVGFEETLGPNNVRVGTDFHKRVIKNRLANGAKLHAELPRLYRSLRREFHEQIRRAGGQQPGGSGDVLVVPDLFHLVRLCTLRAVVDFLLGPTMLGLCDGVNFVDRFMEFQDSVEDATAKAAVLPRWLSLPLILRPVARVRWGLQSQLASLVEEAWRVGAREDDDDDDSGSSGRDRGGSRVNGPWLDEFRDAGLSAVEAGELIVGLLFAAHKNPAIGSAQALTLVLSRGTARERDAARVEARRLASAPSAKTLRECPYLRRCCLETLRLTSHSIGAVRVARKPFVLDLSPSPSPSSGRRRRTVTIPAGETVALSHIASSLDMSSWGSAASEYHADRPEWRTSDADASAAADGSGVTGGRIVETCNDDGDGATVPPPPPPDEYKFAAFSHGTHACPGRGLALAIMQMSLAIMLTYDAEVVGELPDLSFERATLAQRDGPVAVSFRSLESNAASDADG